MNVHTLPSVPLRVKRADRAIGPVAGWIAAAARMRRAASQRRARCCGSPSPPDLAGTCRSLRDTVVSVVNTRVNRKCWVVSFSQC